MTYSFENLSQSQTLEKLFEQYKKEMRYLRNFSEKTLKLYTEVFARWIKYVGEMPTEKNLSRFVIGMREAGLNVSLRQNVAPNKNCADAILPEGHNSPGWTNFSG